MNFSSLKITSEYDNLILEVDPATHGVKHRLGLFEDFLLHKRGVGALHDLLDLELQGGDFSVMCVVNRSLQTVNAEDSLGTNRCHVIVLFEKCKGL